MFKRAALSVMAWLLALKSRRELCRFDCRCLDDIGLDPKDLLGSKNSYNYQITHHPSWDCEIRTRKYAHRRSYH